MGANIGLTREEFQKSVEEKVPLRRLPSASETAKVAVLAASELADYVTGTTLNYSGGHVLD
ncbi:SDR family oxidoreductase [Chloroflexi bacterium TSY]|nr:SDR family oxidoreductase [Chloroflexi bacterium TSY]